MSRMIRTGAALAAMLCAGLLAFGAPASAAEWDNHGRGPGGPGYSQGDHDRGGDHNFRRDRGGDHGDRWGHGDRGHNYRNDHWNHGRRDFGHDRGHNRRWDAHYRHGGPNRHHFRRW